jgi:hypothetical protein
MDNAYYILAKEQIDIERLHICTWDFPNESSYIEFGVEFSYEFFTEDSLVLYLAVPFVKKGDPVSCLLKNLSDRANGRFIFNDVVSGIDNVGEDSRDGSILKFEKRDKLTVLPCDININDGLISFGIKKPNRYEGNLYFRVLIKLEKNTVALKKRGIAQTTYIYDFKINETRNLPQGVYDLKKNSGLEICKVKNVFCLHAIPDNFVFSFVDSSKLKNIRKLETSAFQNYLPEIKGISRDCYNIMFLKDSGKDSYSLFSICTEETIGSKQIALAVGANILCSLLFALASLRFVKDSTIEWYQQIPWEYWGAFAILIVLCIYLFTPLKKHIKI